MAQESKIDIEADITLSLRLIQQREKMVLYELDHEVLATELRSFAFAVRQKGSIGDGVAFFTADDPVLPASLKIVTSSSVRVLKDRIEMEFGGTPLHYGLLVFPEGVTGDGTKKLGDGIWFYSEDKKVPAP